MVSIRDKYAIMGSRDGSNRDSGQCCASPLAPLTHSPRRHINGAPESGRRGVRIVSGDKPEYGAAMECWVCGLNIVHFDPVRLPHAPAVLPQVSPRQIRPPCRKVPPPASGGPTAARGPRVFPPSGVVVVHENRARALRRGEARYGACPGPSSLDSVDLPISCRDNVCYGALPLLRP